MEHNGRNPCFCTDCQRKIANLAANRGNNAPRNQDVLWAVLDTHRNNESKASRSLARN